jgi:HTH-type transcriptional regulator, competence development regulator
MDANEKKRETVGTYLKSIREAKGMSLREVEQASKEEVSNGYLSQLENGKVERPSPHMLHHLAAVFGISYEVLMQKAGYIKPATASENADAKRKGKVPTFAIDDVTADEEAALIEYLAFLRSRQGRK